MSLGAILMQAPVLTLPAGPNGAGKSYFTDFLRQHNLLSSQPINIDALEKYIDWNLIPNDPMRHEKVKNREMNKLFDSLCEKAIHEHSDFSGQS